MTPKHENGSSFEEFCWNSLGIERVLEFIEIENDYR